jgi:hypothetical protein
MKDMNYFVPPHKENESENEQITYDTIAQANNDSRLILNASQGETVTDNELIWKIKTPNYHTLDLTKYSGIKISYELTGSQAYANGGSVAVQGLGLYISSAYEEEWFFPASVEITTLDPQETTHTDWSSGTFSANLVSSAGIYSINVSKKSAPSRVSGVTFMHTIYHPESIDLDYISKLKITITAPR